MDLMDRQCELEEPFEPVVASNEQMARDIIKDLELINERIEELNRNLEINEVNHCKPPRLAGKRKRQSKYGPLARRFYREYLNPNGQVDKTFGIRYQDGKPMIGDKLIDIVGDNIVIDEVYIATPGLWSLFTDKTPKEYDEKAYERYKEPLHETNVRSTLQSAQQTPQGKQVAEMECNSRPDVGRISSRLRRW